MSKVRLNDRAFEILRAEVEQSGGDDMANQLQRDLAISRLKKLRTQPGQPASREELRERLRDIYPDFSEKTLQSAADANRPPGPLSAIKWAAVVSIAGVGAIGVLNLPYPAIRGPVAKTIPMVLLPSFMSMDYNYRQAIALVEQADQLVNKATGPADFDLGTQKVTQAQKHLDRLPVWFLGYYPQRYCTLMGCSWNFTFDEFEAARKSIGRMEATIFQQQNALTELSESERWLKEAKQQYQQAETLSEKQDAIAAWQAAIDKLQEISSATLARDMAQLKLIAANRDFKQVVGSAEESLRTSTLIEAAKAFAMQAAVLSQNPPHPAPKWEEIAILWQEAITRLKIIRETDPGFLEAQKKLAEYQTNLGTVRTRRQEEMESSAALERAKDAISNWQQLATSNPDRPDWPQLIGELKKIMNELESIQAGTTVYAESQQLLTFAREKQKELQSKIN